MRRSGDALDETIESWAVSRPPLSEHLTAEIGYVTRGGLLEPGDPVPGCVCEHCTGIAEAGPAWSKRLPPTDHRRWRERVQRAREVPIAEILRRLGVDTVERGKRLLASSPFREDRHPSLHVDVIQDLWYDFGAGIGGDGIKLWMLTRRVDFATAVRDLTT